MGPILPGSTPNNATNAPTGGATTLSASAAQASVANTINQTLGNTIPKRWLGKGGKGGKQLHHKSKVMSDKDFYKLCIRRPVIHRQMKTSGVIMMEAIAYDTSIDIIEKIAENLLVNAKAYTEHGRRKNMNPMDIVHAASRLGKPLYGFNDGLGKAFNKRDKNIRK